MIKKYFSLLSLFFSILILSYTFYKSEIIWGGILRSEYYIYYVISLLLIIFSIFSFVLNSNIKEYLAICIFSSILSLYAVESYLSFKDNFFVKNQKTKTKFEYYNEVLKKNKGIVVDVQPEIFFNQSSNLFPLSGISNSKTILCNENDYFAIYESDRYGFNNPDSEWDKNNIEYVLVGDSYTHGACVNRPNDIASVMRKLSGKSVLNLGYSGNDPIIEYATLREYLPINVKNIIFLYFEGNDLFNLENKLKKNTLINNYLNDQNFSQNLKNKQKEIDELAKEIIQNRINYLNLYKNNNNNSKNKIIKFLKFYETRELIYTFYSKKNIKEDSELKYTPIFKDILKISKKLADKKKVKLFFVYLPDYSRYKYNYKNPTYNKVIKTVNDLKIPLIDINKIVFKKEDNPLDLFPFGLNGHYNEEGYKKVAKAIHEYVLEAK